MEKQQQQFEEELKCLDQTREDEPGYVELREFFDSMVKQGLVIKQPYHLKAVDPVGTCSSGSRSETESWFGSYLEKQQI